MLIRESQKVSAITGISASVANCIQSLVLLNVLPKSIADRIPVVEYEPLVHHVHHLLISNFYFFKVDGPQTQILRCGKQTGGSRIGVVQYTLLESSRHLMI